jgi:hypothetical protein
LLSLYQHQTTSDQSYRQPGTLRVAVFLCGAVPGVMGRDVGRFAQTQTAGGSDVGLAEVPVAEVDSTRRSAGHRRRYDLISRVRSLEFYPATSEFGIKPVFSIFCLVQDYQRLPEITKIA